MVELALVASKVDAEELTRDRDRFRERAEELEGERTARLTQARRVKHDKKEQTKTKRDKTKQNKTTRSRPLKIMRKEKRKEKKRIAKSEQ